MNLLCFHSDEDSMEDAVEELVLVVEDQCVYSLIGLNLRALKIFSQF